MRRVPLRLRVLLLAAAALAAALGATVVPLFTGGGQPRAEVAGSVPATAAVGQPLEFDVGIDNTGGAQLRPVCLIIDTGGRLEVRSVRFQGLDTEPFRDGRACGGLLNAQETISARIIMVPRAAGRAEVTVVAGQDARRIGPELRGTVEVGGG